MKFKLYKKSYSFSKRLEDYVEKLRASGIIVEEVPVKKVESPYELNFTSMDELEKVIEVSGFDISITKSEYGPYYNLTFDD